MRQRNPSGPLVGLAGVLALLTGLDLSGLRPGAIGWVVGLACGAGLSALLAVGLRRACRRSLLPADRVTLTRAVLVCGVAGLVAEGVAHPAHRTGSAGVLVALASVALVLDAVDGRVARRTGTVHPLGARFDMETDALLILVLSVHVAHDLGWWVLAVGGARYLLLLVTLVGRWAPWLRGQVPARRWRKAVAAYQGIALTVVTAGVLALPGAVAAVALGLALLAASFGTEVAALWRLSPPASWAGPVPSTIDVRALP